MSHIKVAVTGANGQVGQEFVSVLKNNQKYEVYGLNKRDLDVTDAKQVVAVMTNINPDIVIHAAAYTKVDLAEKNHELAYRINEIGTQNIAEATANIQAKLVYISTDYVFSGNTDTPYNEWDPPDPISIYGKTKLAGEQIVKDTLTKHFIVRTSWVYGENGENFVKNMLRLAKEKQQLQIVKDQIGSPTYTVDLVNAILSIMESEEYGIYHVTNDGSCSWYEFAVAIFNEAEVAVDVYPCLTEDFPSVAKRPKYSVLNHVMSKEKGFPKMRHWREALSDFMKSYAQKKN